MHVYIIAYNNGEVERGRARAPDSYVVIVASCLSPFIYILSCRVTPFRLGRNRRAPSVSGNDFQASNALHFAVLKSLRARRKWLTTGRKIIFQLVFFLNCFTDPISEVFSLFFSLFCLLKLPRVSA